jgi:hypothetical protein
MAKTDLVGYCGLHCGACGIYQGRIRQAVENLRRVLGAYGFDKMSSELAQWEPSFKHYQEFEQVMDGVVKLFGGCPACVGGGGDPTCPIRQCCKPKGYATCAECSEMNSCDKLKQREWALQRLRQVKEQGVKNWAEEMEEKVGAGYCYLDEKRQ